jgi:hypothetical protein
LLAVGNVEVLADASWEGIGLRPGRDWLLRVRAAAAAEAHVSICSASTWSSCPMPLSWATAA